MQAQRSFRLEVLVMLAAVVYPAVASAQSPRTPPGVPDSVGVVAQAKKERVAIVSLQAPMDVLKPVIDGLRAGMKKADVEGIGFYQAKASLRAKPELVNCLDKRCRKQSTRILKIPKLIGAKITGNGIDFKIELELWNVEERLKWVVHECETCSQSLLIKAIVKAVVDVMAPPDKVPILIKSDPEGATLKIGDEVLGVAPYSGEILPGKYIVHATLKDHLPGVLELDVEEKAKAGDEVQTHSVVLAPDVQIKKMIVKIAPPTRPFAALKWLGIGASLGFFATGATYFYIDGRGDCADPICPNIYATRPLGYVAVGLGVGMTVATIFMFRNDHRTVKDYEERKRKSEQEAALVPMVVPTRGGAFAQIRMKF